MRKRSYFSFRLSTSRVNGACNICKVVDAFSPVDIRLHTCSATPTNTTKCALLETKVCNSGDVGRKRYERADEIWRRHRRQRPTGGGETARGPQRRLSRRNQAATATAGRVAPRRPRDIISQGCGSDLAVGIYSFRIRDGSGGRSGGEARVRGGSRGGSECGGSGGGGRANGRGGSGGRRRGFRGGGRRGCRLGPGGSGSAGQVRFLVVAGDAGLVEWEGTFFRSIIDFVWRRNKAGKDDTAVPLYSLGVLSQTSFALTFQSSLERRYCRQR